MVVSQATVGDGRDFWLRQHLTAKSHHVRGAIIRRQSEPTAFVASRARSFILFVLCHTPAAMSLTQAPPSFDAPTGTMTGNACKYLFILCVHYTDTSQIPKTRSGYWWPLTITLVTWRKTPFAARIR